MRAEYEKLLAALLSCMSVGSFLQLIQLLNPTLSSFVPYLFGVYFAVCMAAATKAAYYERKSEGFDLTVPTMFDNGVLVLRSEHDKCAAFFALALPLRNLDAERMRRTLITLLKVLPHSSVLSTEMTGREECCASFYIKLNKSDVLQSVRDLAESVLSGFEAVFGSHGVRLLRDEELLQHLALGLPGRIRWVGRSNRYTALFRTDRAKRWLSVTAVTQRGADLVQTVDWKTTRNREEYRVVFAVKNERQHNLLIGAKLILITAEGRSHSQLPLLAPNPTVFRRLSASEITRKLGDLMARNALEDNIRHASFEEGADEILSFLALWARTQSDSESINNENGIARETTTAASEWRRVLSALAEDFGLLLERDLMVSNHALPLRVDARVGSTLFKIVPNCGGDRAKLRWLVDQMVAPMASGKNKSLVLLLVNPSDAPAVTEVSTNMPAPERIQALTSPAQLRALLSDRRTFAEGSAEPPAETVQKIL
jgi:hypothetical protein